MQRRGPTDGNVGSAGIHDAAGGLALDGVKVLAHARVVGGAAARLLLDGIVEARQRARRDVASRLSARRGGEGEGEEGVLHFEVLWWREEEGFEASWLMDAAKSDCSC